MCTTKAPDHADKKPKADHDKAPTDHEPVPKCVGSDTSGKSAEPGPTSDSATKRAVQNPTYPRAMHILETHFRREAEVASLASKAANDGFEAFAIRSSAEYNKSSSIALLIFEAALAAVPAAAAVLGVVKELATGVKSAALLAEAARLAKTAETVAHHLHTAHTVVERAAKIAEGVEHVRQAAKAAGETGKADTEATEASERGEFQIETIHSLTDLAADGAIQRWMAEDFLDAVMSALEFSPASVDITQMVNDGLKGRPLPEPSTLKAALAQVAEQFELNLYISYYFDGGRVTRVTLERDGDISHYFEGMPPAVEHRLFMTNKLAEQMARTDLPTRVERRDWHGNRV